MVAGIWLNDRALQLEATTQARKLISIERNPPIDEVIKSVVVPQFIDFLAREDYPQLHFEDFVNHNAFELLVRYETSHMVFNDDIQGTTSVVLLGLVASLNLVYVSDFRDVTLKLLGGTLVDHTFLFLGAGEVGTGIAELIALEMSKQVSMLSKY